MSVGKICWMNVDICKHKQKDERKIDQKGENYLKIVAG